MATASVQNDVVLQSLITDAYKSVEKMICKLIHNHRQRYGGDLDELWSLANDAFMDAIYTWQAEKGALTTHVYTKIYYYLGNTAKKRKHIHEKEISTDFQDKTVPHPVGRHSPMDLKDLSHEAQHIAHLALQLSESGKPVSKKKLAEFLTQEAKWSAWEILHAFLELSEVFS